MDFFNKHINKVLTVILVMLAGFIAYYYIFASADTDVAETSASADTADARVNPNLSQMFTTNPTSAATQEQTELTTAVPTTAEQTTAVPTTQEQTTAAATTKTTTQATTAEETVVFATAIPPTGEVDYQAQWDAGYLVAIDNPDTTYECEPVTLSDEDRDLLERLCMGEFGSGGFIGAALIAQAVKDAMCFDGYTSVADVIEQCHYTGSTEVGTNDDCKAAVSYIFDENQDAVQHRIMYMYNPELVQSSFHESQNYILTYESVRFFDRWGY